MFTYGKRRKNPKVNRTGSTGFPEGWNSLPDAASLKDSELSEFINGIYLQYGTLSKRQGVQIVGTGLESETSIVNGGMFYDIDGSDYFLVIGSSGKVYKYSFTLETWSLLTGTPPAGYAGTDPQFTSDSPIFNTGDFINMIQLQNEIWFSGPNDRITIFDGTTWSVFTTLSDPTTRPTISKTGSGTGTRTYYYRYAYVNDFGITLATPANTGAESTGDGFYDSMPDIDGSTYLTVTLPTAPTGATRTMIFRGDTAENEFYLASIPASDTTYVDKNINPDGEEGTDLLFTVPAANSTEGYHFYLMESYQGFIVGTTTEFGKDVLVWSGEQQVIDGIGSNLSFTLPDGAGFDGYQRGDGQTINALQPFSVANEDGLAVFKDSRVGLLKGDALGGFNVQNINVTRGTMSPLSPHVAGNNVRFYSQDGVSTIGHEQNYGTILRYSVLGLKADSVTRQVNSANLANVCSEYYRGLSMFGISTGVAGEGNSSILVYDERYDTWSHWTGLHPAVFFKAIHPTTKEESVYFGVSDASSTYGGNVVKMFTGKTDYSTSTGSGVKITLSITGKQIDGDLPDQLKKYDKATIIFGSLFGNGTTIQAFGLGPKGDPGYLRYRASTDPVLSGFGNDEWGSQEVGEMRNPDSGERVLIREYNLRQKDLFWAKLNIQNDGVEDEVTILGIYFYYMNTKRQLPGSTKLKTLA